MEKYPALKVNRKDGNERFYSGETELSLNLSSFWQWSSSDLVNNTLRGMLAEYIVASAIGIEKGIRTEWDAYDLESPDGIKIEVKSSAYIQSWPQKELSEIQFGIQPTHGWDAATNTYDKTLQRQSDVYVFCVLTHKVQETINPLNLSQWLFYIVATETLNNKVEHQKSIKLSSLKRLNPIESSYSELKSAITLALDKSANKAVKRD